MVCQPSHPIGSQLLSVHAATVTCAAGAWVKPQRWPSGLLGRLTQDWRRSIVSANLLATASTQTPGIRLWDTATGELTLELGTDFGDDLDYCSRVES